MKCSIFVSILVFVFSLSTVFAGEIADRWIQFAGRSPEHRQLHHHIFYKDLERQQFDETTLRVFFSDRVYFMGYLEGRVEKHLQKLEAPLALDILYRSTLYANELALLSDRSMTISNAAKTYVAYLELQNDDTVLYHYLIHIAGELFGAQMMANHIQKKFNQLGYFISSIGQDRSGKPLTPQQAKEILHQKIADKIFPDSLYQSGERMSDAHIQDQLQQLFSFSSQMFTAAAQSRIGWWNWVSDIITSHLP